MQPAPHITCPLINTKASFLRDMFFMICIPLPLGLLEEKLKYAGLGFKFNTKMPSTLLRTKSLNRRISRSVIGPILVHVLVAVVLASVGRNAGVSAGVEEAAAVSDGKGSSRKAAPDSSELLSQLVQEVLQLSQPLPAFARLAESAHVAYVPFQAGQQLS